MGTRTVEEVFCDKCKKVYDADFQIEYVSISFDFWKQGANVGGKTYSDLCPECSDIIKEAVKDL